MNIQAIDPSTAAESTQNAGGSKGISRDDFLKLLITQLQNQDPLKPLDNQEFAAQLAAFNSLEQLIGINERLDTLQTKQLLANQFSATALIGKEITTYGNKLSLKEGSQANIGYQLSADSTRVVVNIFDVRGELVRSLEAGSQKMGDHAVPWDGKDRSGKSLPEGIYAFDVNAFDANGKRVIASGRVQGVVTGVSLDGGEPLLEIGELRVPVSAVTGVR